MEGRIISLERQLMHRQEIIEKLLSRIFTLEGSKENDLERPSDDSVSLATNNDALKERKLPIVYEDIATDIDKQNSNSVKRVNKKKRSKQKHQITQEDPNTSTNTDKQVVEKDITYFD